MLRSRHLFAFATFALLGFSVPHTQAQTPANPAVAAPSEDEKIEKDIERLYGEANYDAALVLAEKLVTMREEKRGKEHPRTASAMSDLGAIHLAKGNVAKAEILLRYAVEILDKAKQTDELMVNALSNLSSVYLKKGDITRANAMLERAMAIEEKAGPARESQFGALLTKLASVRRHQGKNSEAEKLILRAVAIHEKRGPERALLLDLTHLGALYRGMGRYGQAVDAFNRVLPLAEKVYGANHPDVGKIYHSVAIFLTGDGQFDKAEAQYQRAESILAKGLGPNHPDVGALYSDWALMLTRTGKMERALELRDKAQTIEEQWLASALVSGTEEDKLAYASRLESTMDRVVSFQMGPGLFNQDVKRFVLRTILRNKAQALEATAASRRALRERLTPENKKRFDDLVRRRGQLASMYTCGPRGQTVQEFQAEVDRLSREADAIDAAIGGESVPYRRSTTTVTIESVAARIPEDAALIEFVQYHHYNAHFYSAASEREKNAAAHDVRHAPEQGGALSTGPNQCQRRRGKGEFRSPGHARPENKGFLSRTGPLVQ